MSGAPIDHPVVNIECGLRAPIDHPVVNVKHGVFVGVLLLMSGAPIDHPVVNVKRGVFVGQSGADVCSMCPSLSKPGCHPKLSSKSYNRFGAFTPSVGFVGATFAQGYATGPEKKPYDALMGYPTVGGIVKVNGTTFAEFKGATGTGSCSSQSSRATALAAVLLG
eukprot:gene4619-14814_t